MTTLRLDDLRQHSDSLRLHSGQTVEAIPVKYPEELLAHLSPETTVVAIDEAQFFAPSITEVANGLAERGLRVMVAGLDLDFRGEPFGAMPELLCRADEVVKLHAICVVCGEPATRTQRLVNGSPARYDDPIILVGAQEAYEARCREHHQVPR